MAEGSAANATDHNPARFQADAGLLEAARRARTSSTGPHIVEGVIGSSDIWNDEIDLYLHSGGTLPDLNKALGNTLSVQTN